MGSCCFNFTGKLFDVKNIVYGSFYSTLDQVNTVGGVLPFTYNITDFNNEVSIENDSRITFAKNGIYNIAFSAQIHNKSGGGSGKTIDIWLSKNGINVSNTNTRIDIDTNSPYKVAAWNFFVQAKESDYYEIKWTTSNASIIIEYETNGVVHPETPSIILTVNQIS